MLNHIDVGGLILHQQEEGMLVPMSWTGKVLFVLPSHRGEFFRTSRTVPINGIGKESTLANQLHVPHRGIRHKGSGPPPQPSGRRRSDPGDPFDPR